MKIERLNIFNSFYQIFGLGKKTINKIYFFAGVNTKNAPTSIKKVHQKKIFKQLKKLFLGQPLEKYVRNRIKFFFDIRS